ncbi:glycoside hydrolase family 43 protein [Subtercola lobariae]|uniref:Glycoside hydrolase 43 family protein n=1 Tax=Subtercola lobariae TaxID=1588641 RepID=A0A917BCS2_9MICO|nr:glycoside hydrolase family 43 protein [Subtercola lobariae]GGF37775.1 glycoside hydrolase 43 family protein [Subtercola lobariae]
MHRARSDAPNPILPGFHPDPSICRVGDDYFLVTSTNEYLPGLPVYTSTDLVSWRQIGNVVTRDSQLDLSAAPSSLGLFAPTLRHHAGTFYLTSTLVGWGHFLMTAQSAAGPWSDPVRIAGSGWDPSLVFVPREGAVAARDDGASHRASHRASHGVSHGASHGVSHGDYLAGDGRGADAGDRAFFHYSTGTSIRGFFIDLSTGEPLSDEVELWAGTGGNAPEGPHLYLVGGYWYLVIAEGGTSAGHAVTVARSTAIEGPYQPHPDNPVLTHRGLSSPIQSVGHADLVETPNGQWFAVVLGSRPLGGHGYQLLGRETFLVSVSWQGEADARWPVFGTDKRVALTTGLAGTPVSSAFADDFVSGTLDPGWLFIRTAHPTFARVGNGELALAPTAATLDDAGTPAFVGRRQSAHSYFAEVTVRLDDAAEHDDAAESLEGGLVARRDERHHYRITIADRGAGSDAPPGADRYAVEVITRIGDLTQVVAGASVSSGAVRLKVQAVPNLETNPITGSGFFEFSYLVSDEAGWHMLATLDSRYLSTEVAAGFTGTVIGMYAHGARRTHDDAYAANGMYSGDGGRASTSPAAHFSGWRSGADPTRTSTSADSLPQPSNSEGTRV